MSMPGNAAAVEATAIEAEEAAAVTRKHKARHWIIRACWHCVPKPKTPDNWNNLLSVGVFFFIPLWFWLSYLWSPNYTPKQPWVWSVPDKVSLVWFAAQMSLLVVSIQHSSKEIRWKEILIAFLPFISCLVTIVFLAALGVAEHYHMGPFQINEMVTFFWTTLLYAVCGGGVRFALKGRYFGNLNAGNTDHSDN